MQIIGALDAARDLTVAHTSERVQFGRPLSKFQAVQHSLAEMAGEIERARAATELAIAAATDFGFDSAATDYAVTVAKVATGRAVGSVTTIAHQLHGAIGVTVEHRLWLFTMRARSWIDDFGTTTHYAQAARPPDSGRRRSRGRSSSAVQHLVDARLDVDAVTEVGQVDSEPLGQRIQHVGGRREPDPLGVAGAVDRQIAATQIPAGVVGDERNRQPGDEARLRMR